MPVRKHHGGKPQLKEGVTWYVEWWAEVGGKRSRVRKSRTDEGIDLNAIADLNERRRVALEWISRIEKRLVMPGKEPWHSLVVNAMMEAVQLKASPKANTMRSYRCNAQWFCDFLREMGWGALTCAEMTLQHVQAYFDYLILRKKVSNTTHNTRKSHLRALFTELVQRQYLAENLVSKVKYRPEQDTIRRPLSEAEEHVIMQAIREDQALYFAYLVQRYLGVRPGEIRNLRVGYFRLDQGMLVFPGRDSKNNRNSTVTIPDQLVPLLRQFGLERANKTHYCLGGKKGGGNGMSGPVPMGVNTLSEKFRTVVRRLHKAGLLQDITGIQFYSLKDTLAVYMLDHNVDVESAMRHLRQRDLEVFQRYVKRLGVKNEKIQALPVVVPKM